MPKRSGGPSKLSAEEKLIEKQREELLRKTKELEERLVKLPAVIEKNRELMQQEMRRRAQGATGTISPGRSRRPRPARRPVGTPARRARQAKIQAVALLLLFATIVFLVLRAIPQG
jgi:hypothetical protein